MRSNPYAGPLSRDRSSLSQPRISSRLGVARGQSAHFRLNQADDQSSSRRDAAQAPTTGHSGPELGLEGRRYEFAGVVELGLGLSWVTVRVTVAFVEAPCVSVFAVDVDLEQLAATPHAQALGCPQQGGPNSLATALGDHVQLVEQRDGPVVPDVRSQAQHGDADGWPAREDCEDITCEEEVLEPGGQDARPWGRGFELAVEPVEQGGYDGGVLLPRGARAYVSWGHRQSVPALWVGAALRLALQTAARTSQESSRSEVRAGRQLPLLGGRRPKQQSRGDASVGDEPEVSLGVRACDDQAQMRGQMRVYMQLCGRCRDWLAGAPARA